MSNKHISNQTAVILLAAGMAQRMGSLKQLLPLGTSTVMGVTLANISASDAGSVIVVVGAMKEETSEIARQAGATVVNNPDYQLGMSTSLRKGLEKLEADCELFMVALADQPLTKTETYNLLLEQAGESDKGIAIPVYEGQKGNPIIFKRRYLPELLTLKGDVGGRELLKRHPEDIFYIEVRDPGVVTNVNTPDDYEKLKNKFARGGCQSA
jgi:molybdenum cofactor cytidylyltransferase